MVAEDLPSPPIITLHPVLKGLNSEDTGCLTAGKTNLQNSCFSPTLKSLEHLEFPLKYIKCPEVIWRQVICVQCGKSLTSHFSLTSYVFLISENNYFLTLFQGSRKKKC